MDKDVVVPLVETSEAPEDTTSHEITPGTSQQSSTPPEISEFLTPEISEDISTSRENTPCPIIQSTQRTPLDTISTLRDTHVQLSNRLNKPQFLHHKNLS